MRGKYKYVTLATDMQGWPGYHIATSRVYKVLEYLRHVIGVAEIPTAWDESNLSIGPLGLHLPDGDRTYLDARFQGLLGKFKKKPAS